MVDGQRRPSIGGRDNLVDGGRADLRSGVAIGDQALPGNRQKVCPVDFRRESCDRRKRGDRSSATMTTSIAAQLSQVILRPGHSLVLHTRRLDEDKSLDPGPGVLLCIIGPQSGGWPASCRSRRRSCPVCVHRDLARVLVSNLDDSDDGPRALFVLEFGE
jgi:hypothetical protein